MLKDDAWIEQQLSVELRQDEGFDKRIRLHQLRIRQAEEKILKVEEGFDGGLYSLEEARKKKLNYQGIIEKETLEISHLQARIETQGFSRGDAEVLRQELRGLRERNLKDATFEERVDLVAMLGIKIHPSEDLKTRRIACKLNLKKVVGEREQNGFAKVMFGGSKDNDMSFSADTGMGECLVIGRKSKQQSIRATFVVLNERPSSTMTGASAAVQIHQLKQENLRNLEDGPLGGSPFYFGDGIIGYAMDAPLPEEGTWNLVRIKDGALAQVAYQMVNNNLVWLPGMAKNNAISVPISTVSGIGKVGPYHMDINANTPNGVIRCPFKIEALKTKSAPTYPVLWAHDANRERGMEFEADSEGILRQGKNSVEDKFAQEKDRLNLGDCIALSFQQGFQV